jgi:hypothetical protein
MGILFLNQPWQLRNYTQWIAPLCIFSNEIQSKSVLISFSWTTFTGDEDMTTKITVLAVVCAIVASARAVARKPAADEARRAGCEQPAHCSTRLLSSLARPFGALLFGNAAQDLQ